MFGPYEPQGVLGRGGMGVVWRARHRETGALAAVKTVRAAGDAAALHREIRALSNLRHPGIARILDQGDGPEGTWFAMELVVGQPLGGGSAVPAAETLTVDDAFDDPFASAAPERRDPTATVGVFGELCWAVAHLHGAGFVHGDLKPANVLVDAAGRPVLVDLGLVSTVGPRERTETLARTAYSSGTVAYMAPEVIAGQPVDARADLYALGCMLYELLAGSVPFVGTVGDVLNMHQHAAPRPLGELVPDVDLDLEALVDGLLVKDPAERRGSALQLARRLGVTRTPEPRPALRRPALRGREALLARLQRRLEAERGFVILAGEAGVGKTRLAMELVHHARRRGFRAVVAGAVRVSSGPLAALREVLPQAETLAPVDPYSTEVGHRLVVEGAVRGLTGLAEARPTLVLVDDVQWADALSLEVLERLASAPPDVPLVVVCTSRPDLPAELASWAEVMEVGPLEASVPAHLVADMLGAEPPAGLLAWVEEVGQRSPFWVAEAVHAVCAAEALRVDGAGRWVLDPEALDALGRRREALTPRRLAALSADARHLATRAAILGRAADAVLAAMSELDDDAHTEALWALEASGLLITAGPERWSIGHANQRQAILETLTPAERQGLHRRAAALLEAHQGARASIARHWHDGGRPELALPHYLEAGREAVRAHAARQGAALLEEALALAPDGARLEVLLALGEAVTRTGDVHRQLAVWGEARQRAEGGSRLVATLGLARAIASTDDSQEALALAEAVHGEARSARAWDVAAQAARLLSGTLSNRGDMDAATAWAREGIACAEALADPRERARQERQLAMCLWGHGRASEGLAVSRALLAHCEELGDAYLIALAHHTISVVAIDAWDYELTAAHAREAARRFGVIGDRRQEAISMVNVGGAEFAAGRLESSATWLRQGVQALSALGDRRTAAVSQLNLGNVLEDLGRYQEALEVYEASAATLGALGDAERCRALVFQARVMGKLGGDLAMAAACLDEAHALATERGTRTYVGIVALERVRLALVAGRDGVEELARAEAVLAGFDELPRYLEGPLEHVRALVRGASG